MKAITPASNLESALNSGKSAMAWDYTQACHRNSLSEEEMKKFYLWPLNPANPEIVAVIEKYQTAFALAPVATHAHPTKTSP